MSLNPVNLIDKYISTSYDVVKKVYDNLAAVVSAGNAVDTNQVAASNPTTRADGSPLQTGDTYFNTNENVRYIYNEVGPIWVIESNFDAAALAAANAATSESNAATSETNAATSETNAGLAQTAAELAQTAAELAETNVTADLAVFISGIGANVASAAALPLLNDGDQFIVTGAISITSMDTLAVGKIVHLIFNSSLTLTHHATNLILPGGVDIITATGDVAVFHEYAIGDWRLVTYQQNREIRTAQVAGHVRAGNKQIRDGAINITTGNVTLTALMVENVSETFGPTGSGATNIWPALDVVPASARIIHLFLRVRFQKNGTADTEMQIRGGAAGTGLKLLSMTMEWNDAGDDFDEAAVECLAEVPCTSAQVFTLEWDLIGGLASFPTATASYVGFTTDF